MVIYQKVLSMKKDDQKFKTQAADMCTGFYLQGDYKKWMKTQAVDNPPGKVKTSLGLHHAHARKMSLVQGLGSDTHVVRGPVQGQLLTLWLLGVSYHRSTVNPRSNKLFPRRCRFHAVQASNSSN
jgi:hypothetical protein